MRDSTDFALVCVIVSCIVSVLFVGALMPDAVTYRQVTYRLLPRKTSAWRWLDRTLEDQRQLYNAALQERVDCWRKTGKSLTWQDQFRSLTRCRREIPGMKDTPVAIQRGTLKRLDHAMTGFFRRAKAGRGGFPRFKGRRHWNSIAIIAGVRLRDNALHIPRYGPMTVRRRGGTPYPDGVPKSATLRREGGKWYAVVAVAIPAPVREDNGHAIGIDMNAGQIATSDGALIPAPDTGKLKARARRYRKQLARRRRGSRRREITRARLAKTTRRIATVRRNWHHRTSRALADAAGTIVIEDLQPARLTRSAKGTVAEPGRNVRAKAGLNREILATGWAALRRMLAYKAHRVIAVDPRYTSQTCAACGHVDARSRKTRERFHCVACGHADHADLNAAANILASGTGAAARGGRGGARPVNREDDRKCAA